VVASHVQDLLRAHVLSGSSVSPSEYLSELPEASSYIIRTPDTAQFSANERILITDPLTPAHYDEVGPVSIVIDGVLSSERRRVFIIGSTFPPVHRELSVTQLSEVIAHSNPSEAMQWLRENGVLM